MAAQPPATAHGCRDGRAQPCGRGLMMDATLTRADFVHLHPIDTRWLDNDAYGHVNNVVYYSFFDTTVNHWLITQGLLDIHQSPAIGLVVETGCRYFAPLSFPDHITAGLRVSKVGTSSVRYELALFRNNDPHPAAAGHFVHVYVDRESRRPVPIPTPTREALVTLQARG